ncbi:MAG: apurinic endonuclease APN1 [Candidatus Bathyarchaeota archaeon B23]|nr:MAG: apurinic endonuclease APN1 [Candidatus Bathyarchaeota archaeon B23]
MRFGFHISIKGSIDRAVDRALRIGCDTFQLFTRNPRSWGTTPLEDEEVEAFKAKLRRSRLQPVFSHMPYILNLASPYPEIYRRSIESLEEEIRRCEALGVRYIVTHLGSHRGAGGGEGVRRVAEAVSTALRETDGEVLILLENGSGAGTQVGSRFEELGEMLRLIGDERAAVCLDTCHAFAAGYEWRNPEGLEETMENFQEAVGFENLILLHLNDSIGRRGSGIDHHEHIGLGEIGEEGFRLILNHSQIRRLPIIMETPIDERRTDQENLRKAKELAGLLQGGED